MSTNTTTILQCHLKKLPHENKKNLWKTLAAEFIFDKVAKSPKLSIFLLGMLENEACLKFTTVLL